MWLRGHNVIMQINDVLFMHGGLSPKYAELTIREIKIGCARRSTT